MTQAQRKSAHPVRDWPFAVKPLHPVIGCEITGITLAEAVSPGNVRQGLTKPFSIMN